MMYLFFIIISLLINSLVIGICTAGIAIFIHSKVSDTELICSSIVFDLMVAVAITLLYQIRNLLKHKTRELNTSESEYYIPLLQGSIAIFNKFYQQNLQINKDVSIKISNKSSLNMIYHIDKTIVVDQLCKHIKPAHLQKLFFHELILLHNKLKAKRLMVFASNVIVFSLRNLFLTISGFTKKVYMPLRLLLSILLIGLSPIFIIVFGWGAIANKILSRLNNDFVQSELPIS